MKKLKVISEGAEGRILEEALVTALDDQVLDQLVRFQPAQVDEDAADLLPPVLRRIILQHKSLFKLFGRYNSVFYHQFTDHQVPHKSVFIAVIIHKLSFQLKSHRNNHIDLYQ
jgi:hypothetical protein